MRTWKMSKFDVQLERYQLKGFWLPSIKLEREKHFSNQYLSTLTHWVLVIISIAEWGTKSWIIIGDNLQNNLVSNFVLKINLCHCKASNVYHIIIQMCFILDNTERNKKYYQMDQGPIRTTMGNFYNRKWFRWWRTVKWHSKNLLSVCKNSVYMFI